MFRAFFFLLSLLSDYRGVSDLLHAGVVGGVINTGVFLGAMVGGYFRTALAHRVERGAFR